MPVWAAILLALGSGIFGTLATITHQRGAEFRTRMIEAADDLVAAATEAAVVARNISHEIQRIHHEEGIGVVTNEPPGFDEFAKRVDSVTIGAMRVSLLFGISEAAARATGFTPLFRSTIAGTLYAETRGENVDFQTAWDEYVRTTQEFIASAREEIRSTALLRRIRSLAHL